jgi:hypothetical protein
VDKIKIKVKTAIRGDDLKLLGWTIEEAVVTIDEWGNVIKIEKIGK